MNRPRYRLHVHFCERGRPTWWITRVLPHGWGVRFVTGGFNSSASAIAAARDL